MTHTGRANEVSAATVLIPTKNNSEKGYLQRDRKTRGRASGRECPRGGYLWLNHKRGRVIVPATCKTWTCRSCRNAVLQKVKNRIEHGVLTLGTSYFITVTVKYRGVSTIKNAPYVAKAWERLLYRLKRSPRYRTAAWFKVPELTQKGQIHLHVVLGGIGDVVSHCEPHNPPHAYDATWRRKPCDCLEHEWSQAWHEITGDSYVVDCRPVRSAGGMAGYLGNSLKKGMYAHDGLEKLGFKRRWSASNNWPPDPAIRLAQTVLGTWRSVSWSNERTSAGHLSRSIMDRQDPDDPLLTRVGSDLANSMAKTKKRRRLVKFAGKVGVNVTDMEKTIRSAFRADKHG